MFHLFILSTWLFLCRVIDGGQRNSLNQLSVEANTDRQTLTFIPVGQLESLIHLMCFIGSKHRGNLHECRDNMQTAH